VAEYRGRKVKLNSIRYIRKGLPTYGIKKFEVFVKKDDKIERVTFGSPDFKIKTLNKQKTKSFRARHNCDTNPPKDKTKARYWS
jgi:hypothetical protein